MTTLHLTRVAFACTNVDDIPARQAPFTRELASGQRVAQLTSARIPRRDLAGGSLYWIIRHHLVARQAIVSVQEMQLEGKVLAIIQLDVALVLVSPIHYRAHQGWRYLAHALAPADMSQGAQSLPPELAASLAELSLI